MSEWVGSIRHAQFRKIGRINTEIIVKQVKKTMSFIVLEMV